MEQVQHEILENPATVYNFRVADFHTYFVTDSNVLVHNANYKPSGNIKGKVLRGGRKASRDKWYGYNDKNFQNWWHKVGKQGQDIDNAKMAKEVFEEWVSHGKPKVK